MRRWIDVEDHSPVAVSDTEPAVVAQHHHLVTSAHRHAADLKFGPAEVARAARADARGGTGVAAHPALFDDDHLDDTCDRLVGVSEPDPAAQEREAALRAAIADCDRKLANYRALLDHEDAVTVAASWIADTQRQRNQLERQLGQQVPGDKLTAEQVKALVKALKDIVRVLAAAEPTDKSDLYDQLGISLAYDPDGTVTVESRPRGVTVRVGGGT